MMTLLMGVSAGLPLSDAIGAFGCELVLKVRALSSEGKMTAWLLSALPVCVFGFIFISNPGFYLDVADDPMFMPGLLGIVGWYTIGMMIIRKLVTLKV